MAAERLPHRHSCAHTMCMAEIHSFVRKTAFQTANRPHRKAAAPRRESAASLAAPRHVSMTVVKISQLELDEDLCYHGAERRRGVPSRRGAAAYGDAHMLFRSMFSLQKCVHPSCGKQGLSVAGQPLRGSGQPLRGSE